MSDLDEQRRRFETACLVQFVLRRAAGTAIDDNGSPASPEALFWRDERGNYGVRHFNAAWWGWRSAAPVWRDIPLVDDKPDESEAPFDGKPVLIKTNTGVVEAWWAAWEPRPTLEEPGEGDGYRWVCYDDAFQLELSDAKAWMPLP